MLDEVKNPGGISFDDIRFCRRCHIPILGQFTHSTPDDCIVAMGDYLQTHKQELEKYRLGELTANIRKKINDRAIDNQIRDAEERQLLLQYLGYSMLLIAQGLTTTVYLPVGTKVVEQEGYLIVHTRLVDRPERPQRHNDTD